MFKKKYIQTYAFKGLSSLTIDKRVNFWILNFSVFLTTVLSSACIYIIVEGWGDQDLQFNRPGLLASYASRLCILSSALDLVVIIKNGSSKPSQLNSLIAYMYI